MSGVEIKTLSVTDLVKMAGALIASGGRMQMMYAWLPAPGRIELRYLSRRPGDPSFSIWRVVPDAAVPSLAPLCPLLGWYEREATDLFGVEFENHPEPERLVLHPGADPLMPPLRPDYPIDTPMPYVEQDGGIPEVSSPDVQQLPFGPVRADVVESVELLFLYVGEHILHYHPRLFFKHRGMEKRFEGKGLAAGAVLAERISGVGSVAHALAFCQAVERAARIEVPKRARMLRSMLAELERIYNHLHYLGHLADATSLKVGNAEGKLLEERAKQINAKLTGSRFLRSILAPGGLRRDVEPRPWLSAAVELLRKEAVRYAHMLEGTNSYLDRLITTGVLSNTVAFDQGATGPVERASGVNHDLRRDHPYAGYSELEVHVVYVLRMQHERMLPGANFVPSLREYAARWGITPERLRDGQRVMHPGPINRGVELDPRVADGPHALVVDQVRAGLVVRMAVLYDLLTAGPVPVEAAVGVA